MLDRIDYCWTQGYDLTLDMQEATNIILNAPTDTTEADALLARVKQLESAIDEQMVSTQLGVFESGDDPVRAIKLLMDWSQDTGAFHERDFARAVIEEAEAALEGAANVFRNCDISTGYCCCGDSMDTHPDAMSCGHMRVDMGEHTVVSSVQPLVAAALTRIREWKEQS